MRAFVAVATLGSFAAAARQLRLSSSAVSRAVAELETRLGLVLFNRTTRSVKLTERGRIYLESCRQILEDIQTAESQARGEEARPNGVLTVAAPVLFGRLHVLPLVQHLLAQEPALAIRLILADRNAHMAEEGVDVAVRIGEPADSSLVARPLGRVCPILVASPDYLDLRGTPVQVEELSAHDIIAFEAIDATNEWRLAPGLAPVRLHPRMMVNNADAAIAAAEAGAGITRALSYQVRAGVEAGRLVPLFPTLDVPQYPVNLLYPPRRIMSPNLNVFLQAASRHFRENPVEPLCDWQLQA